jgi:hypothetical protein
MARLREARAMILTTIDQDRLPATLQRFAGALDGRARTIFEKIARPEAVARAEAAAAALHHQDALRILTGFGMGLRPGPPAADFSWDGHGVRCDTEAYVLLHEAAHFQLAAPERRRRIDFGLGPGPETGNRAAAKQQACLFGLAREREEATASLLGILWEVELGHPALASFLDQNWLEGAERLAAAAHFRDVLAALVAGGFITTAGRPTRALRQAPDPDAA